MPFLVFWLSCSCLHDVNYILAVASHFLIMLNCVIEKLSANCLFPQLKKVSNNTSREWVSLFWYKAQPPVNVHDDINLLELKTKELITSY